MDKLQSASDFDALVTLIEAANQHFEVQVSRAVNVSITLRSWVIGYYIVQYEQAGRDRSQYGSRLIEKLSKTLKQQKLARVEPRDLRRYRSFAVMYPQIRQSLTAKSPNLLPGRELAISDENRQSATAISSERLISTLSFTHICELLRCEEPEKRAFYESDLEDQLLDKLQEFLLELGQGFCFDARQRRILIGDKYYFVDLVFYHRILKCHVLVDLKLEDLTHENIGQLNTYVSWFDRNVREPGDMHPNSYHGVCRDCVRQYAPLEFVESDGVEEWLSLNRHVCQQVEADNKTEGQRVDLIDAIRTHAHSTHYFGDIVQNAPKWSSGAFGEWR